MDNLQYEDLFPYYHLRDSTVTSKFVFEISRAYTEKKSSLKNKGLDWRPWDRVAIGLYLGKLPSRGNQSQGANELATLDEAANNQESEKLAEYTNSNQHEAIIDFVNKVEGGKRPLGLVVSVVDYNEFVAYPEPVVRPVVSPTDWKEKNVDHILLPMSDFKANASNASIIATVKAMREYIQSGKAVYIHCKAGRSRSALLCAIYIAIYGDGASIKSCLDTDECLPIAVIEDNLKSKRPQVEMMPAQREKGTIIIDTMKKMLHEQQEMSEHNDRQERKEKLKLREVVLVRDQSSSPHLDFNSGASQSGKNSSHELANLLHQFLSSLELKNAIIHFLSFKTLAIYACKNQGYFKASPLTENIKDFFTSIYEANDDRWYLDLINGSGPMLNLMQASETAGSYMYMFQYNTKNECEVLKNNFIDELNKYLARTFYCSVKDIKRASETLYLRALEEDLSHSRDMVETR